MGVGLMIAVKKLRQTGMLLGLVLMIAACSQATPVPNVVATNTLQPMNTEIPITELFSITDVALARTQPPYVTPTPITYVTPTPLINVDNADFSGSDPSRAATWTPLPADLIPATVTPEVDIFTDTPIASTEIAAIDVVIPTNTALPVATETATQKPTATLIPASPTLSEPTKTPRPSVTPLPTTTPAVVLDMTEAEIRAYLDAAPMSYQPVYNMREIYAIGQSLYRRDNASIIGVGDCNTAHRYFLKPLHADNTDEMGVDMSFAQSDSGRMTVAHFEDSFENTWESAHVGYNAFSVLDSFTTSSDACDPNETPLDCDIRRYSPVAAFVMFGPNDLNVLESPQYEAALRTIIESSIAQGVIPILSTFVYSGEYGVPGKVMKSERHNAIIISLAYEYQIPFVNLWRATLDMDYQGIHDDNAHLRNEGLNERNRLAIEVLDVIRREIIAPEVAVQPTSQ
ncbi:MAG: hypothetical protein ACPG7F_05205 [Aggregatilineales bacterium]